jgi:putative ABC transport system permease protein
MRSLTRKLARDILRSRGQILSIALVVAAGVMSAVTMRSTLASLERSRDRYYREYRMGDVFVSLNRAPEQVAQRIGDLPGVATVESRVRLFAVLSVPGLERPATGSLISVPDRRRRMLGDLHLVTGRYIESGRDDEVIASERFVEVNGLAVGDTIAAVINGRYRTLRIVGTALSPEFVYEIEPTGGFLGDERLFGVFWMAREPLAAANDMAGAFNDLVVRLAPGASEREVIDRIDDLLRPYGGLGAYGLDDQISHRLVSDEILQLRTTATFVPIVFLGVAAFLLNILLARLVALERDQIATLKAFGYRNSDIALHYLGFATVAIGAGSLIGLAAGFWLGAEYVELYARFFRFPELAYRPTWGVGAGAIAISAAAALGGAFSAVRAAARLQPAEGMRAESPARFRPLLLERVGLHHLLSPAQRMVMRNLERRPLRAVLSVLGVAASLAVLTIGYIMLDSMSEMMRLQFTRVQREDLTVTFADERDIASARELRGISGVVAAEPFRMVPVRLAHGHRSRRLALTGLQPEGRLRVMIDGEGARHPLPHGGVVLTDRLARTLRAGIGDTLRVELLDRAGEERAIVVAATMDELVGVNGYLALAELDRLTRSGPQATGAWLTLERGAETRVLRRLREYPAVSSTTSKRAMLRSFETQIGESFGIMTGIMLTLSGILAVGVIYNGARIALSERGRELASLRVLGFTKGEVAAMLLGEQAVITLAGIPLGALLGVALGAAIVSAFDTELYRIPLYVRPRTLVATSLAIIGVATLAGLLVRRRLDRADLIAVLKTRE